MEDDGRGVELFSAFASRRGDGVCFSGTVMECFTGRVLFIASLILETALCPAFRNGFALL